MLMDYRFRPHNYINPNWETERRKQSDKDKKFKYTYSDEGLICSVRDYEQSDEEMLPSRYIWKTASEAQPNASDNSRVSSRALSPSPPDEIVQEVNTGEDVAFLPYRKVKFCVPVSKQKPKSSTSTYKMVEFHLPVTVTKPTRNKNINERLEDYRIKKDEMVKEQRKEVLARMMEDRARDAVVEVVLLKGAARFREGPFWESVVPGAFRWKGMKGVKVEGVDPRIELVSRPYIPVDMAVWDMLYQNAPLMTP
ncbi:unnamed protein product [Orchesella dallaii]|uniref:Uncharacterized protein n=1 Tax=Orchesella dallaii TaxID=48710 RepID=A0ABP1RAW1_9HEXA